MNDLDLCLEVVLIHVLSAIASHSPFEYLGNRTVRHKGLVAINHQ